MIGQALRGAAAVASGLIGLQVVGTILAVAIDTDDWFFLILGLAVALAISGAVIYGAAYVAARALTPLAAGWLGLAVGRPPYGHGAEDGNLEAALGSLLLLGLVTLAGIALWRHGHAVGDPFHVVTGLLLLAMGWLVGLAGLIPRLYFWHHPGPAEAFEASGRELPTIQDQASGLVIGLVVCAMAGMGMAKCTAASVASPTDAQGRMILPVGDWIFTCVDPGGEREGCVEAARFTLRPPDEGQRIRLTVTRSCPEFQILDGEGQPVEPLGEAHREALGIVPNEENPSLNDLVIFDHAPGQSYTIELAPGRKPDCHAGIRFAIEPTSGYREAAP